MTILVVEDDRGLAELIKEKVVESGYETAGVHSAQDALDWLSGNTPYMMLLDYSLPDMNAKKFLIQLQKKERPLPPFIVSTGQGDERIAVAMMKLGARDYIIKDSLFLDRLPEVIKRVAREIENENKRMQAEAELRVHKTELDMQNEELLRSQADLEAARKRYFDLYDLAPVGYVTVSEKGMILEANLTAANLLGMAKKSLVQQLLTRFVIKEDQDIYYRHRKRLLETDEPQSWEMRMLKKDGTPFWGHLGASVQDVSTGGAQAGTSELRIVLADITSRKQMEEEILRAQKLESLGTLAGGIARDFNNLMTVVMGHIELVLMDLPPGHVSRQRLLAAIRSVNQTREVTTRLITFSRGGGPIKEMTDVIKILQDAVRKTVKDTAVKVKFDFREDVGQAEVDDLQIIQCFYNLTRNAVEAMPEGGNLTVQAENALVQADEVLEMKEGSYLKITFADEGIGIPEELQAKIFDPYFTTKKMGAQQGLGLGLAVCYFVIKQHGGHITVKSSAGKGAAFVLYLPVRAYMATKKEVKQPAATGTVRVLIMDDDPQIQEIERIYLELMGYDVTETQDGQEAIDAYKKAFDAGNPFDLVMLDLTVRQGMGGQMAMTHLLKINPAIKAIVASGYVADPVMEYYSNYGFQGALKKPFQRAEMKSLVERVLIPK